MAGFVGSQLYRRLVREGETFLPVHYPSDSRPASHAIYGVDERRLHSPTKSESLQYSGIRLALASSRMRRTTSEHNNYENELSVSVPDTSRLRRSAGIHQERSALNRAASLQNPPTLSDFKAQLKTFLFQQAFPQI